MLAVQKPLLIAILRVPWEQQGREKVGRPTLGRQADKAYVDNVQAGNLERSLQREVRCGFNRKAIWKEGLIVLIIKPLSIVRV